MKNFRKILSKFRTFFVSVSAGIAVLMMLIILIDVVTRTITGRGINGSVQMIELGMLSVVFFATAQTQYLKEHVGVDIIVDRLKPNVRKIVDLCMLFLYITFCGALTYYTFNKAVYSTIENEVMWMGVDVIPQWPFRFVIPIGFFMLVLQLIDDFSVALERLAKPLPPKVEIKK